MKFQILIDSFIKYNSIVIFFHIYLFIMYIIYTILLLLFELHLHYVY